jgi:DNA invertase Pin-like site-specific DNA recombinase
MVMAILNECMKREIEVWTIKDNYRLGSDINSKVLAFAFGLSAEIERNLISQRTKEALARKRAEGVILGRPKGSLSKMKKLTGKELEIKIIEFEEKKGTRIVGSRREILKAEKEIKEEKAWNAFEKDTIVDGEVVKTKTYPTDEEFCKFLEVSEDCLKSTIKIETKKCNCKGGCC